MTRMKLLTFALALVASAGTARPTQAQDDPESIRQRLLIPIPDETRRGGALVDLFRGAPGTSTGTPLAFGPGMGDFFVGGGYTSRTRATKNPDGTFGPLPSESDGSVSAGFGLGDATDAIGLSTVITSLSTFRSGFGNRTAFSFSVFRNLNSTTAVAVGVENAFIAGGQQTDGQDSWYGVISKVFLNPMNTQEWLKSITLSGGVGNGRFRSVSDVNSGNETVNVFASAAAQLHEQFSVITDWTGQDLNVGASFVPFKQFPISITPAFADVLGIADKSPRFMLSAGIGLHF
jgi:hypothetical protein